MQLNEELLELTFPYIDRPDQVQGPGGNTSVKNEQGEMMIKASGFRFEEINSGKGFSVVNNQAIREYFIKVKPKDKTVDEKESLELILDNVVKDAKGNVFPRPSMETGFHSVLGRYVVHTHSVWTNLINCCQENVELIKAIKSKTGLRIANIPYVSPGFGLSYLIAGEIKNSMGKDIDPPQVFFLENHGIIAHESSISEVNRLLKDIDQAIISLIGLKNEYPENDLEDRADQAYQPVDSFVNKMIAQYKPNPEFFEQVLFPDQTVFFSNNISFGNESDKKIRIDTDGHISYHANFREALSMHETMTAYFFIYHSIISINRRLRLIPSIELDYINGMDMEKHRRSLME